MARRDTNFYYSFAVLPRRKREAIVAVWDFLRAVDDAVDEPGTDESREPEAGARARLAVWRRELAACYGDGAPRTRQGQALAPAVAAFGLPRRALEDVIDGVEMDVAARRWPTFADLHQYCLRVASAVGLVCVEIFGYRNPSCRQYAIDLGVALQLTNILRDLGRDLSAGRLYLPLEDLDRFEVTEADLRSGVVTPAVRALLEHEAARAHDYYARSDRELPREDARSLVAARIMSAIYRALLRRIEMRDFPVFGPPVRLSRAHKMLVASRVWAVTMLGG